MFDTSTLSDLVKFADEYDAKLDEYLHSLEEYGKFVEDYLMGIVKENEDILNPYVLKDGEYPLMPGEVSNIAFFESRTGETFPRV